MAQTKHRKKTVKNPPHHHKKGENKTSRKNARKAALVMMCFFGIAGMAVGYLLSDSLTGIIVATIAGLLAGLIVNKLFSSAAKEE